MSTNKKNDPKFLMAYERSMFRSAVKSLFWSVISERKKRGDFTFQAFAKQIGSTKHEVSRWFSGDPNWTLNTIASIARALDLDLRVEAIERSTGRVFTSAGLKEVLARPQEPARATREPVPYHYVGLRPATNTTSEDRRVPFTLEGVAQPSPETTTTRNAA